MLRHSLIAFACVLASGCSPEQRYEVLSFLFDGVPRPGEVEVETVQVSPQYIGRETARGPTRLKLFRHKPTLNDGCGNCHPKNQVFLGGFDRQGRCFGCHEHNVFKEKLDGLAYLHGPVAVQSCLACHDPHDSLYEGLLVDPVPKLCFGCHDRESVLANAAHQDQNEERCLGCHDPHGGTERYFLRAEAQL